MSLFFVPSSRLSKIAEMHFHGPSAREFCTYSISEQRRLKRACIHDICDMDADEGGFRPT